MNGFNGADGAADGSGAAGIPSPPIVGWMSALGDPTRARILHATERHELTVADLCKILQSPQSTVSRHLKVLAEDGWLTARREGTSRLYRMARGELDPAARRLWALVREQTAATPVVQQDDQRLARVIEEQRSRSQAFFRSTAGYWDRLRAELFGDRFDLEALAGLLDADWTVGDLGCGTGRLAATLAPFVGRVVAVESSREMIDAARARLGAHHNVELRTGDLEALPIEANALDAATMSLVLHHVAHPPEALAEAARVLKPGARLLIIDMYPHDRAEYREQMGHAWLGFEPERLQSWLGEAGLARPRIVALRPDSSARGPALFAATASVPTVPTRPIPSTDS